MHRSRRSGASTVILNEPVEMRRKLALSLGADAAIDPSTGNLREQIRSAAGKDNIDVVIECAEMSDDPVKVMVLPQM